MVYVVKVVHKYRGRTLAPTYSGPFANIELAKLWASFEPTHFENSELEVHKVDVVPLTPHIKRQFIEKAEWYGRRRGLSERRRALATV